MRVLTLFLILFSGFFLFAQENKRPVKISANSATAGTVDGMKIDILRGAVRIVYDDIILTCDSAYNFKKINRVKAFSNVVINQGDSLRITGDSLTYDSDKDVAKMRGNVRLEQEDMSLETDFLTYYTDEKQGYYTSGGKLLKDGAVLTSQTGYYNDQSKMARFNHHVSIDDPEFQLWADTLNYNLENDITYFFGPTVILSDSSQIYCEGGFYNTNSKNGQFYNNTRLQENARQVIADTLVYYQDSGKGQAVGNVFFRDTTDNITLFSGKTYYDNRANQVMATDSPTILLNFDNDTLYVAADTLISTSDSTGRLLKAFHAVDIYRKDLQGACDSLIYSEGDSNITLYNDPAMWVDSFQFTGDTITLFLVNKKMDKLLIRENAFLASKLEEEVFNQIKGRTLTGKFEQDSLRNMLFDGNAETIYFAQDDSGRFIGPNSLTCAAINLIFEANELSTIRFLGNPEGQFDPIQDVSPASLRLDGFIWNEEEKPVLQKDFNLRDVYFKPIEKPAWAIDDVSLEGKSIKK